MIPSEHESFEVIWLNDRFVPLREAKISPLDRGFLYGDGLFETMRAEEGCVLYWMDHLERLYRSMATLRLAPDLSIDWNGLFHELLHQNRLTEGVAVVKVILTRGVSQGLGLPAPAQPTLCVIAHPYAPPPPAVYQRGWRLHIFQEGFAPPLARYKSLNYLYFLVARQAAVDANADESLILDHRGNVAETAAGSLLARTDGKWWAPVSNYQLPGITLRHVVHLLSEAGQEVKFRPSSLNDILSAQTLWVLNSLMGIMSVSHVGSHSLEDLAIGEAEHVKNAFFQRGKTSMSSCSSAQRLFRASCNKS